MQREGLVAMQGKSLKSAALPHLREWVSGKQEQGSVKILQCVLNSKHMLKCFFFWE